MEVTNGPSPRNVYQIVRVATTAVAVAVPRLPNLSAAQTTNGKTAYTYESGLRSSSAVRSSSAASMPAASSRRPAVRPALTQVSRSGATSTSPSTSPDHQTNHRRRSASGATAPLAHRLATPSVALSVVLASAPTTTRAITSRTRSSEGRKSTTRVSSHAAATASSVFPVAIPAAPTADTPAVQLSRNVPSAMPGQRRRPSSSKAASARPEGGQAEETTGCATAASKPTRAAAK